jgi:uncharacterized protein
MEPDAAEIRVLGCLIEKQRTTPDVYPLTLNSLRLACNQSTNRDPVVSYDEGEIRGALDRLVHRKWATLASWSNRRAMKYRHTLDRTLGLDQAEVALLGVLMLRGPQTPGELRARSDRLHSFGGAAELDEVLGRLSERRLVERLGRRPGQREERYRQLLGAVGDEEEAPPAPPAAATSDPPQPAHAAAASDQPQAAAPAAPPPPAHGLDERLERLEREVAELRAGLASLRDELGA